MDSSSERKKKNDGAEEVKKDVSKMRSPQVEESRGKTTEDKGHSKNPRSFSVASTTKTDNYSVAEKTIDIVNELKEKKSKLRLSGIQPNIVAVIISLVLQLIVAFYILALLLTTQGVNIIYLIVFLLMGITAVFFTVEVIISKEKYFVLLSLADSLLVCGGSILILVLLIKFSEIEVTGVLHIAAVTIVVQVCHVFALTHHCYVKYLRKNKEKSEEPARCSSCREAAGHLPPSEVPPRSPAPVQRSPPQIFYTEDCGHTPISKHTTAASSKNDAENERSSVKTKVTWFDTIEIATTPKGCRPMRYLVEV